MVILINEGGVLIKIFAGRTKRKDLPVTMLTALIHEEVKFSVMKSIKKTKKTCNH
jgi:hypothetical protein